MLAVEAMESRLLPSVVTTTADSGPGSLRQAILDVDAGTGGDAITFDIPGSGVQTIAPVLPLPDITRAVTIDGYSQPGASPNTVFTGDSAVLLIELSGASETFSPRRGLTLAAAGITVKGLIFDHLDGEGGQLSSDIIVLSPGGDTIAGNVFGFNPNDLTRVDLSNDPVFVLSSNNTIGGLLPADRNVISASGGDGVTLEATSVSGRLVYTTGNLVEGNYIGTNPAGTAALGHLRDGVLINRSANNTIGGTISGAGNLLSGNSFGVAISGDPQSPGKTSGNRVEGNFIGTDADGTANLGNGDSGVDVFSASNNTIGGTEPGAGNIITFNGIQTQLNGVQIESGTGNAVLSNRIFGNGKMPIKLGGNDVLFPHPNDFQDVDTGADNLQNFPVIEGVTSSLAGTTIRGKINTTPSTRGITIQFYAGHGQPGDVGTFLGSTSVDTDGQGNATFQVTFPAALIAGDQVAATATDPGGNTSEFSGFTLAAVTSQPDLQIQVNSGDTTAPVGQDTNFGVAILNLGNGTATHLILTDPIPAGATFVSAVLNLPDRSTIPITPTVANGVLTFDLGDLAPDDPSIDITLTFNATTPGILLNTATVTGAEADPTPDNNTGSAGTRVLGPPIEGTLNGTAPGAVALGQDVTYTLTPTFTGSDSDVSGTLTDRLPANATFVSATGGVTPVNGVLTFDLGDSLNLGDSSTFTVVVHPTAAGTLTNQAQATFTGESGSVQRPLTQTTQVTTGAVPTVDLEASIDTSPRPLVGQDMEYDIGILNVGTATATNLSLTDPLPANATFVSATVAFPGSDPAPVTPTVVNGALTFAGLGSLDPDQAIAIAIVLRPSAVGALTNSVTVAEAETDATPANNTASIGVQVVNRGLVGALTGTAPDTAPLGQDVTYTLTATYTGSDTDVIGKLTDTLPSNATFVSATGGVTPVDGVLTFDLGGAINGGDTSTFTVVVHPTAAGTLTNQSNLAYTDEGGTIQRPLTQATTVTTSTPAPSADLVVSMAPASPSPVAPGGLLTYGITVGNSSFEGDDATNVVATVQVPSHTSFVSLSLPEGFAANAPADGTEGPLTITITAPTVQRGQAESLTLVVRVDADAPDGTAITGAAGVSSDTADPVPANNSASATATVSAPTTAPPTASADLSLVGTATPGPTVNGQLAFSLTVVNNGSVAEPGVTLTAPLPPGLMFVSAQSDRGSVTQAGGTVTAALGTLEAGARVSVTIVATPTVVGPLTSTATVSGGLADPDSANNSVTLTTTVVPAPAAAPPTVEAPSPTPAASGPTILRLSRFGYHTDPTLVVLYFGAALDPSRASNAGNYVVFGPGPDHRLGTGDDQRMLVSSASYDPSSGTVTLRFVGGRLYAYDTYTITVIGTGPGGVADPSGRLLDGRGNGGSGSNYVARFGLASIAGRASEAPGPASTARSHLVLAKALGKHSAVDAVLAKQGHTLVRRAVGRDKHLN
jgi:uncharacterized repeat protein (TIGR01451 family)